MDDLWAEGLMGTLISLTVGTLLCGAVGALIGHRRGRRTEGLILGLLLGPLGWLWVAVAPSRKPAPVPTATPAPSPHTGPTRPRVATGIPTRPCPACAKEIPQAAVKCRHCGARIASPSELP
jgi:hypothetical protein